MSCLPKYSCEIERKYGTCIENRKELTRIQQYWFPIRTKNDSETQVFNELIKSGYKVYMPFERYKTYTDDGEIWKVRSFFKGKMFVFCGIDEIKKIAESNTEIKFYFNNAKPATIHSKHILFIKKMLSSNKYIKVSKKIDDTEPFIKMKFDEYGDITLYKVDRNDSDILAWKIPVLNEYMITYSNSPFLKYLILEHQEGYA